ncbi:hypothetical protein [Actinopolymorpha alba]|uniref:hypothetical protein n=1 Tax=Actinopolymorpha alba TaxID=533267 RepID=UPI0003A9B794|nr:hypothetical protein [Actinopolymorpha alba]
MSSPEERPGGGTLDDRPADDRPAGDRPDDEPAGDRPSDRSASDDGEDRDPETPLLAPIPPEGTSAPADAERVFGRPAPTSAFARIVSSTTTTPANGTPPTDGTAGGPGGGPGGAPGAGPDGGPTTGPTGTPAPAKDELRRLRDHGRLALVFGIGALLTCILAFPLGLLLGIVAIVLGTLARRGGRRVRLVVPGAAPGLVLGVIATVFASVLALTAAVFWNEIAAWQECSSGANTLTAMESCQQQLQERVLKRVATLD